MGKKRPYKICRVGGKEFHIFWEYDSFVEKEILIYPDFKAHPEYTTEGRPFATAVDEGCSCGKPREPENTESGDYSNYGDCGGCVYFNREETPWDIIGVCMCDARIDIRKNSICKR